LLWFLAVVLSREEGEIGLRLVHGSREGMIIELQSHGGRDGSERVIERRVD
jgi:hypothetical protein